MFCCAFGYKRSFNQKITNRSYSTIRILEEVFRVWKSPMKMVLASVDIRILRFDDLFEIPRMNSTLQFKSSSRHRAKAGFSLVELMVVVAVVVLLMALLLPALSAAREASRTTQCQARMRQLFAANYSYMTENKLYMPMATEGPLVDTPNEYNVKLTTLKSWSTLYTPLLDPGLTNYSVNSPTKQLTCPSSSSSNMAWVQGSSTADAVYSTPQGGPHYGINASNRTSTPYWGTYSTRNDQWQGPVVANQVRWGSTRSLTKPTLIMAFGECIAAGSNGGWLGSGSSFGQGVIFRHRGGSYTYKNPSSGISTTVSLACNTMLFDGHIKFWNFGDAYNKGPNGEVLVGNSGGYGGTPPWQDQP